MNAKEHRELDAWIAEYVFGFNMAETSVDDIEKYTIDPGAAMQVLEKCAEKLDETDDLTTISLRGGVGKWRFGSLTKYCDADTLPLAICQFARKLFAKEGK